MATTLSRPTNATNPKPLSVVYCPPHAGQAVAHGGWFGLTTSTGRCPGWAGRQPCGGCHAAPPAARCPAAAAPRRQRPPRPPCLHPPALQVPTACRPHRTPLCREGAWEKGRRLVADSNWAAAGGSASSSSSSSSESSSIEGQQNRAVKEAEQSKLSRAPSLSAHLWPAAAGTGASCSRAHTRGDTPLAWPLAAR